VTQKSLCLEAEQGVFRKFGYTLECECQWGWNDGSRLNLYFIPLACASSNLSVLYPKGYCRIEALDGKPPLFFWIIFHMAALAKSDYVPDKLELLPQDDWSASMITVLIICSVCTLFRVGNWRLVVAVENLAACCDGRPKAYEIPLEHHSLQMFLRVTVSSERCKLFINYRGRINQAGNLAFL
jgi:hypothetical protein